jgi:hypothetical protein
VERPFSDRLENQFGDELGLDADRRRLAVDLGGLRGAVPW